MKTKKKGHASGSRFGRNEKAGTKTRHGARRTSGGRRGENSADVGYSSHKPDQETPTA